MIIVPPITLGDNSTFTRASTALYYDINGYLSVSGASVNEMRLEYDPYLSETNVSQSTVAPYYLIEGAATNLITYPRDFSNAVWSKSNTYIIPNVEGQNAFARQNADKLVENTLNGGHYVYYGLTGSNETTTFSVYAKAGERTRIALRRSNSVTESIAAYFDLSTGTVVAVDTDGTDYYGGKASIKRVRDNWYRCSFTVTKGSVNTTNWAQIDLVQSGTNGVYTGDGVSGLYIAYAQLETGSTVTSPIPDTTAFVSRASTATYFDENGVMQTAAINVARSNDYTPDLHLNKGLTLEAAATNLLTRSQETTHADWTTPTGAVATDNIGTALDGTSTVASLIENTSTGLHAHDTPAVSFVSGTVYTFSVFVRDVGGRDIELGFPATVFTSRFASFDLVNKVVRAKDSGCSAYIQNMGNSWYRVSVTSTCVSTSTARATIFSNLRNGTRSYTGDGVSGLYHWGVQLETGYVATSYIPTTSTTVTRAADISTSVTATRAADVVGTTNAIVKTNVGEADYTAWNSGTAYTIGTYVRYVASNVHKVYVALTNNTNKNPTTNPQDWQDAGSTNAWKMFDQSVQSQTSSSYIQLNIALNGNPINCITLMNVYGKSVRAVLSHKTDGVIYDQTINLIGYAGVTDWYYYFYNKYYKDTSFLFTDIPSYGDATLTLEFKSNSSDVTKCGVCVLGSSVNISAKDKGEFFGVEHGAKLSIQDYSVKEQDDFGNYTILERPYAKRSDYTVYMEPEDMNGVFNLLASRRATPTIYIGSNLDKHRCTIDYGFYKDFSIEIAYPEYSICTIQIEGLT